MALELISTLLPYFLRIVEYICVFILINVSIIFIMAPLSIESNKREANVSYEIPLCAGAAHE